MKPTQSLSREETKEETTPVMKQPRVETNHKPQNILGMKAFQSCTNPVTKYSRDKAMIVMKHPRDETNQQPQNILGMKPSHFLN